MTHLLRTLKRCKVRLILRALQKVATIDEHGTFQAPKTKPQLLSQLGFRNLILTMTYSHMGKPHTTIGDASFHY